MTSRYRTAAVVGLAAILCIMSLVVSSCGKKRSDMSGIVTITFWHSFVASTVPAFNDLVQRFEREHPGIHINAQYVPTGDALVHKLVTAVQGQTAPDISWIHSDFLDKLVEAGALYRIDEFLHGPDSLSPAELADIVPALLRSATWRDTLYALPMEATSLALLYNRDLFRKAGLDPYRPPADWNELREYARKLTVDRDGDGKTDQYGFYVPVFPASGDLSIWMVLQWTPFLWQAGGEEVNEAQTQVLFNSTAGVQALTLWREMYDDMHFSTFTIAHDLGFASGILAMILDGPWNLPRYRMLKGVDWAVAPLPAGPAGRATYLAGEHMAIFRQSKHPREAWTFVRWMVQPEVQAMFSIRSGYLPVRKSTLDLKEYKNYLATDPALSAFVRQMADGRGRTPIDYHRTEINRYLAEAVEKATLGRVEPKTALDEAAARANGLLSARQTRTTR